MRPQPTLATRQAETNMYTTYSPTPGNHILQPMPAGSAPSVSADWNLWQARLQSGSNVLPEQFFNSQASFFTERPVAALLRALLLYGCLCSARTRAEGHSAATQALAPFSLGHATEKDTACCRASATPENRVTLLSSLSGNYLWWRRLGLRCPAYGCSTLWRFQ